MKEILDELDSAQLKDNEEIFRYNVDRTLSGAFNPLSAGLSGKKRDQAYNIQHKYDSFADANNETIVRKTFDYYVGETYIGPDLLHARCYTVKDNNAYKEFQNNLIKDAETLDKLIDDSLPDDEIGTKARNFVKAQSTNTMRNTVKGYSDEALGYKTPLGTLFTSLSSVVLSPMDNKNLLCRNIIKYEKSFPIYDFFISSDNLRNTFVDYYIEKDNNNGFLNPERESFYRQKIYEYLIPTMDFYNKSMAFIEDPASEAKVKEDGLIDKTEKLFNMHPMSERGTMMQQASLEAYKIGLENGWALEDIPLLCAFNAIIKKNEAIAKGFPLKDRNQLENIEVNYKSEVLKGQTDKMKELFESFKTKKLNGLEDRNEVINSMKSLVNESTQLGCFSLENRNEGNATYFNSVATRIKIQDKAIEKGLTDATYDNKPVISNENKLNDLSQLFNTARTDGWFSSESDYHKNLKNAINDLQDFCKKNAIPNQQNASEDEIKDYYAKYISKLDKVKHFCDIYIDKRTGASSKGGKERLKGAADFSNYIDLERNRIVETLGALDNELGDNIDDIRQSLAELAHNNAFNKFIVMDKMPKDVEGRKDVVNLAADILVARILGGQGDTGKNLVKTIGTESFKAQILKNKDFQNVMKNYFDEPGMTPAQMGHELTEKPIVDKFKKVSSSFKKEDNKAKDLADKKAQKIEKIKNNAAPKI